MHSENNGTITVHTRSSKDRPPTSRKRLSRPIRRLLPPASTTPVMLVKCTLIPACYGETCPCQKKKGGGNSPTPLSIRRCLYSLVRLALLLVGAPSQNPALKKNNA